MSADSQLTPYASEASVSAVCAGLSVGCEEIVGEVAAGCAGRGLRDGNALSTETFRFPDFDDRVLECRAGERGPVILDEAP